jgi:AcrR family transcriptional regulator
LAIPSGNPPAAQNGFEATSLADIAREAKVPLGNVYYYFKTKDEIGEAIVELRLAHLSAQRQRWDEAGSPKGSRDAPGADGFRPRDFKSRAVHQAATRYLFPRVGGCLLALQL